MCGEKVGHYISQKIVRYMKEQINTALQFLDASGLPSKVIEILVYSSNPMLYHRKKVTRIYALRRKYITGSKLHLNSS